MWLKALQAQALQLMALGIAGAQTVVPVSGSPVLLTMPNTSQLGAVKPTIPASAATALPLAQLQPAQSAPLPVLTSMPPILPKITTSLTTPTPTSAPAPPLPQPDSINRQLLMEQLANSVTKNGSSGQQDSDINEELIEFMKYDQHYHFRHYSLCHLCCCLCQFLTPNSCNTNSNSFEVEQQLHFYLM